MKTRREALAAGAVLGAAALMSAKAQAASASGLTKAQAEAWLRAYGAAWTGKDADAVVKVFTPGATYRDHAFQPPFVGRQAIHDYWAKTVADQSDIRFTSTVWAVEGNVVIAHWTAAFGAGPAKTPAKLDGVFRLTFDGGLCSELLEWWFFG
jgi:ketosteroid isomerase-like protein